MCAIVQNNSVTGDWEQTISLSFYAKLWSATPHVFPAFAVHLRKQSAYYLQSEFFGAKLILLS